MEDEKREPTSRPHGNLFNSFMIVFVIIGMLLAGSITVIYNLETKDYLDRIMLEEKHRLALQQKAIIKNFESIFADLVFLSKHNELITFLNFNDPDDKKMLEREYLEFSRHKKIYDQIRYIDENGMETARVNFNNGRPEIVPDLNLQSKKNRYYFEDAFVLNRGQIFVSPLDLNIEKGKIETPLKPMIRFGMPVFDDNSSKKGVIVLNFLANTLIDAIKDFSDISLGQIMLLNNEGFWLTGAAPEDEWGFMYKDRQQRRFGNTYPKAWQHIMASDSNQMVTRDGIFTSITIYPFDAAIESSTGSGDAFGKSKDKISGNRYFWKLVTYVSEDKIKTATRGLFLKLFAMGAILFLLGSIPSYLIAKAIVRRKMHQMELIHMANFDKLTQLPNRVLFMDRLSQNIHQAIRYKRVFALLFIDLDGFKAVNDSLGHDAGDDLLSQTARRLSTSIRKSDTVARIGGDEFTIILSVIKKEGDAIQVAEKIIDRLSDPFQIKENQAKIGASIGISIFSQETETAESLIKKADRAMYAAKNQGKNRCVLHQQP